MDALRPCPFCGGEAELIRGKDLQWGHVTQEQWGAGCKGDEDSDCYGVHEPSYFTASFAIAAWNRRTPEEAE